MIRPSWLWLLFGEKDSHLELATPQLDFPSGAQLRNA